MNAATNHLEAMWSIFGVLMSETPENPRSPHPKSSASIMMTFGGCLMDCPHSTCRAFETKAKTKTTATQEQGPCNRKAPPNSTRTTKAHDRKTDKASSHLATVDSGQQEGSSNCCPCPHVFSLANNSQLRIRRIGGQYGVSTHRNPRDPVHPVPCGGRSNSSSI